MSSSFLLTLYSAEFSMFSAVGLWSRTQHNPVKFNITDASQTESTKGTVRLWALKYLLLTEFSVRTVSYGS